MAQRPLARLFLAVLVVGLPFVAANAVTRLLLDTPALQPLRNPFKTAVLLGAYALFVRLIERRPVSEWSAPGALRELALGFGGAVSLITVAVALLGLAGWLSFSGWGSGAGLAQWLWLHLFVALLEELLFRALLFRLLEGLLGSVGALAISTLLFGLAHGVNPGANAFSLSVLGLLALALTLAFMATRRLWLCVGLHWGWNVAQGGLFGLPVSGMQVAPGLLAFSASGPEWATGGAFGLEASLLSVGLLAGLSLYLGRLAQQRGNWRGPAGR